LIEGFRDPEERLEVEHQADDSADRNRRCECRGARTAGVKGWASLLMYALDVAVGTFPLQLLLPFILWRMSEPSLHLQMKLWFDPLSSFVHYRYLVSLSHFAFTWNRKTCHINDATERFIKIAKTTISNLCIVF
jgi:hypothetical protein